MKIDGGMQRQDIGYAQVYKFQSRSGDGFHLTIVGEKGAQCSCPGYLYRQHCVHIDKVPAWIPPSRAVHVMVCGECGNGVHSAKPIAMPQAMTTEVEVLHEFKPCGHVAKIQYKEFIE